MKIRLFSILFVALFITLIFSKSVNAEDVLNEDVFINHSNEIFRENKGSYPYYLDYKMVYQSGGIQYTDYISLITDKQIFIGSSAIANDNELIKYIKYICYESWEYGGNHLVGNHYFKSGEESSISFKYNNTGLFISVEVIKANYNVYDTNGKLLYEYLPEKTKLSRPLYIGKYADNGMFLVASEELGNRVGRRAGVALYEQNGVPRVYIKSEYEFGFYEKVGGTWSNPDGYELVENVTIKNIDKELVKRTTSLDFIDAYGKFEHNYYVYDGVPYFTTKADLNYYIETGDLSKAMVNGDYRIENNKIVSTKEPVDTEDGATSQKYDPSLKLHEAKLSYNSLTKKIRVDYETSMYTVGKTNNDYYMAVQSYIDAKRLIYNYNKTFVYTKSKLWDKKISYTDDKYLSIDLDDFTDVNWMLWTWDNPYVLIQLYYYDGNTRIYGPKMTYTLKGKTVNNGNIGNNTDGTMNEDEYQQVIGGANGTADGTNADKVNNTIEISSGNLGSIINMTTKGFNLLGNNGYLAMLGQSIHYIIPQEIWDLLILGVGIMVSIACLKFIRG